MEEPDFDHFHSIPWCSTILSDPSFAITPTYSREYKASTEDSLMAETLRSSNTIAHCLSIFKASAKGDVQVEEVRSFLTLGSGMNGDAHFLHGGIICTLLDDVMGTLLTVNKNEQGRPLSGDTVTAKLEVKFLQRIGTPGTVMMVAKVRKKEGRKFWLDAWIENGEGEVLARSEALWMTIKKREGKL